MTPLRRRFAPGGGVVTIGSSPVEYSDGGESLVLALVEAARDLSTLSKDLHDDSLPWAVRYHLSSARANVVRLLDLAPQHSVLEIGAGCGAVTRYLGEQAGIVDAVEPVHARAIVARARCRDLNNVEVFEGVVTDLPREAAYDAVVAVGVLEYIASGGSDEDLYVAFLGELAARLRPGGRLLVASENRLGVKYLAGAPEDHTGMRYLGVEGYRRSIPARTFNRHEFVRLFRRANLDLELIGAFPDYKEMRVALHERLFTGAEYERALAWQLPQFPSPDEMGNRAAAVDERSLWVELVRAGLGIDTVNSFVAIAGSSDCVSPPSSDWIARLFTTNRVPAFSSTLLFEPKQSGMRVKRSTLTGNNDVVVGPLRYEARDASFVIGRPLVEELADAIVEQDRSRATEMLGGWRDLVYSPQRRDASGRMSIDAVPRNVIRAADGQLHVIDEEWWLHEWNPIDVVERGAMLVSMELVDRVHPDCWKLLHPELDAPFVVADVARRLGSLVGLVESDGWLRRAVDREAALQARIELRALEPTVQLRELYASSYRAGFQRHLVDTRLGHRDFERLQIALARVDALTNETSRLDRVEASLQERDEEVAELRARQLELEAHYRELVSLKATKTFRYSRGLRRIYGKLRTRHGIGR